MDDLTITRLCAEAMGYAVTPHANRKHSPDLMWVANGGNWNPLHDDAQAMALVKRFLLDIRSYPDFVDGHHWIVVSALVMTRQDTTVVADLNRAICECVARMQKDKP